MTGSPQRPKPGVDVDVFRTAEARDAPAVAHLYAAMGGACVEKVPIDLPGGVPDRLTGVPNKLRIVWPDASELVR